MLVDRGLADSRTRAQALIMAGLVFNGTAQIAKAGQLIADDALLDVRGRDHPWVSRGGIKLDHALTHLGWDIADVVAIDVGASTGGFTDVLLQRGARRVYAVDSGTNQLAWRIRQDERVITLERTNARHLDAGQIPEPVDLVVCDASFIGLAKVLECPLRFAKPVARLIALIKPQFEAERTEVGKAGIVRDPDVHKRICESIACWLRDRGWTVGDILRSPITGQKGNIEFLVGAMRGQPA